MSYYFLGAGGIGMSALALALAKRGERVFGGDKEEGFEVSLLKSHGAPIDVPERADRLEEGMTLVYSSAIKEDHPVFMRAKELSLEKIHRSELLQKLITPYKQLVVTGVHGKTTTSTLLAFVLERAGLHGARFIGGHPFFGGHGDLATGPYAAIEGDESDGSMLKTDPFGAIITSIDFDHMSYWKSEKALLEAFHALCAKVSNKEHLWISADDTALSSLPGFRYGFDPKSDLCITDCLAERGGMRFNLGQHRDIFLPLFGRYNVQNAAAVFGLCESIGIDPLIIREALKQVRAPKRRQELLFDRGALIFTDYGHHPSEVIATLKGFKEAFPEKKIVLLFQPHRFSRLKENWEAFHHCFSFCDTLLMTKLYSAGEKIEDETLNSERLISEIKEPKKAFYISEGELKGAVEKLLDDDTLLIAMGAGSIDQWIRNFCEKSLLSPSC